MAKSPAKKSVRADLNTFVQGLITEASPLNFPVNASVDEENFELNRDGSRDRRLGMGFEDQFNYNDLGIPANGLGNGYGVGSYVWSGVGGNSETEFLVVQVRSSLYFYNTQVPYVSYNGFVGIVNLNFDSDKRWSFANVDGNLVVVAGSDRISVVEYATTGFTVTDQRLKVRDVWGVQVDGEYESDDNYRGAADERQIYNLQNQSWGILRRTYTIPEIDPFGFYAVLVDPLDYFYQTHGSKYPSNSETVYAGLQFAAGTSRDVPSERMYPTLYDDVRSLGTRAAKGYFIIDLLRRGQSRIDQSNKNRERYPQINHALNNTKADYTPGGPTVARGFAGRVFYSGFDGDVIDGDARSPSLSNFVLFSQLVKNIGDINKCYQEGDPTSRESPDIIDTDGGFIKIAGADKIIGLRPIGNSLIVFATNGIWEILGGNDYGFSATNYKVTKLSSIGAFSETTIVEEVGRLFFWGQDGIYIVGPDQFQSLNVKSITQTTIQKLYDQIPSRAKSNAAGVYDLFSKKVRWVYNRGAPFTLSSENRELIFDTTLNAFYENRIGQVNFGQEILAPFVSAPYVISTQVWDVVVGNDNVLVGGDSVTYNLAQRESKVNSVKYVVFINKNNLDQLAFSISLYNNSDYRDWSNLSGGVDAKAYLLTGARTAGDRKSVV